MAFNVLGHSLSFQNLSVPTCKINKIGLMIAIMLSDASCGPGPGGSREDSPMSPVSYRGPVPGDEMGTKRVRGLPETHSWE